jgi:hypothetical protein
VGLGAGSAQRSAIAIMIIGGQTLCLLLTLLLTPVAYSLAADLSQSRIWYERAEVFCGQGTLAPQNAESRRKAIRCCGKQCG